MGYDIQFASNEQLRKCRLACIQLNKLTTPGAPQPTWPQHSTVSRRKRLISSDASGGNLSLNSSPGYAGLPHSCPSSKRPQTFNLP